MHPSNRYARQAQTQRTLRDLIASKSALLPSVSGASIGDCCFHGALASRLGEKFLVADLPRPCAALSASAVAKVYEPSR